MAKQTKEKGFKMASRNMPKFEIDFLETHDDGIIINELKRIASLTGKDTVTKSALKSYGRVSYSIVNSH